MPDGCGKRTGGVEQLRHSCRLSLANLQQQMPAWRDPLGYGSDQAAQQSQAILASGKG